MIQSSISSITPAGKRSALNIGNRVSALRRQKQIDVADALQAIEASVHGIENALAAPEAALQEFAVLKPDGSLLAWFGTRVVNGEARSGFWAEEAYLGGTWPDDAPFFAGGSSVVIGKNGTVSVQDIGGNEAAWIGVQEEAAKVITAATNAPPSVVTITAHGYITGDTVYISGATGNTAINGYRTVVKVDADKFTLRDLATGAAINGNGTLGGSPTAIRYYGGMLAQTFAVGPSFSDYRLRAFATGDLSIHNALILLEGTGATIELDPTDGEIKITKTGTSPQYQVWLHDGQVDVRYDDGSGAYTTVIPGQAILMADPTNGYEAVISQGLDAFRATTTDGLSQMLRLFGYTDTTTYGPKVLLAQARGTGSSQSSTESGDRIGSIAGSGYKSGYHEAAEIRIEATENWDTAQYGTRIVFETTPTGTGSRGAMLDILGNQIGFWGSTPASKQTLNAYTTDAEGSAYGGIATGVGGFVYAAVADLNNLRVAYENLRASYDDLRTKLKTTTLVA